MIYILIPISILFFCLWKVAEYELKYIKERSVNCKKAVALERKQVIQLINESKKEYLKYRGSSFDKNNNLLWAKDDAEAYSNGMDKAISIIMERK